MFTQRLTGFIGEFADRPAFPVPATILDTPLGTGLPLVFGPQRLDLRRRLVARLRHVRQVLHLQHDVFFERVLDLRVQVEHRQLQQTNGLLQLRRHSQGLPEF